MKLTSLLVLLTLCGWSQLPKEYKNVTNKYFSLFGKNEKELKIFSEHSIKTGKLYSKMFNEKPSDLNILLIDDINDMKYSKDLKQPCFVYISNRLTNEITKRVAVIDKIGAILMLDQKGRVIIQELIPILSNEMPFKKNDEIVSLDGIIPKNLKEIEDLFKRKKGGDKVQAVFKTGGKLSNYSINIAEQQSNVMFSMSTSNEHEQPDGTNQQKSDEQKLNIAEKAFSHELMHRLVLKNFEKNDSLKTANQFHAKEEFVHSHYREGFPDFMFEGLSLMAEPEDLQAQRLKNLGDYIRSEKRIIPLDSLFKMHNPFKEDTSQVQGLGKDTIIINFDRNNSKISQKEKNMQLFYEQTSSFFDYLKEKEGRDFIIKMNNLFYAKKEINEIINESKNIPKNFTDLENDFKKWILLETKPNKNKKKALGNKRYNLT
jgi:hypothetical protein